MSMPPSHSSELSVPLATVISGIQSHLISRVGVIEQSWEEKSPKLPQTRMLLPWRGSEEQSSINHVPLYLPSQSTYL